MKNSVGPSFCFFHGNTAEQYIKQVTRSKTSVRLSHSIAGLLPAQSGSARLAQGKGRQDVQISSSGMCRFRKSVYQVTFEKSYFRDPVHKCAQSRPRVNVGCHRAGPASSPKALKRRLPISVCGIAYPLLHGAHASVYHKGHDSQAAGQCRCRRPERRHSAGLQIAGTSRLACDNLPARQYQLLPFCRYCLEHRGNRPVQPQRLYYHRERRRRCPGRLAAFLHSSRS